MLKPRICGHRVVPNGFGSPNLSGQFVPSTSPPNHSLRLPAMMNSVKNVGEKVCTHVGASDIVWFESNSRPATPLSMGWPTPPAVAVLRKMNLVVTRKEGSTVFYSLVSPQVAELLAVARRILTEVLASQIGLLDDLRAAG